MVAKFGPRPGMTRQEKVLAKIEPVERSLATLRAGKRKRPLFPTRTSYKTRTSATRRYMADHGQVFTRGRSPKVLGPLGEVIFVGNCFEYSNYLMTSNVIGKEESRWKILED